MKWSDSATLEAEDEKQRQAVVAGLGEQGAVKKQGKQSRVADAGAHASPAYKACRAAVKAVDQDLYQIPPDMLCQDPRVNPCLLSPHSYTPSHWYSSFSQLIAATVKCKSILCLVPIYFSEYSLVSVVAESL